MIRLIGFIMFWIAVGMIISLLIKNSLLLCICIIIVLIILGFNMFCH